MRDPKPLKLSIIDYGLCNLYSVHNAFKHLGVEAQITSDEKEISASDALILPGVGAFSDAMDKLKSLDYNS